MKIKISYTLELGPDAVKHYKESYGSGWLSRVKMEAEVNGSIAVEEDWIPTGYDWTKDSK